MEALHGAAYNAWLDDVTEALAQGAPVDARDEDGFTPLLWSCFRGAVGDQLPVVTALLAAGADPNAETGMGDANCLILAAACGKAELIAALAEAGADVNRPVDGLTPLMTAARDGSEEIVAILLRLGARAGLAPGGFTAADYARYSGHDASAAHLDELARKQAEHP